MLFQQWQRVGGFRLTEVSHHLLRRVPRTRSEQDILPFMASCPPILPTKPPDLPRNGNDSLGKLEGLGLAAAGNPTAREVDEGFFKIWIPASNRGEQAEPTCGLNVGQSSCVVDPSGTTPLGVSNLADERTELSADCSQRVVASMRASRVTKLAKQFGLGHHRRDQ